MGIKKEARSEFLKVSMPPIYVARVNELKEHIGVSASEIIRRGIDVMHDAMRKERFGYMGAEQVRRKMDKEAEKQRRDEQLERLNSFTDEELTAWLVEIGFIDPPETDAAGLKMYSRIETSPTGAGRSLWSITEHPTNPAWGSRSERMNWPEILSALRKEKRI